MYTVTLTKQKYYTLIDTILPRGRKTLEKYSSLGTVSQENGYLNGSAEKKRGFHASSIGIDFNLHRFN